MKNKSCGDIIKNARISKNLTQGDLASLLNETNSKMFIGEGTDQFITIRMIKEWEKGKDFPSLEQCYELAAILDINPTELLTSRNKELGYLIFNTQSIEFKRRESLNLVCWIMIIVLPILFAKLTFLNPDFMSKFKATHNIQEEVANPIILLDILESIFR